MCKSSGRRALVVGKLLRVGQYGPSGSCIWAIRFHIINCSTLMPASSELLSLPCKPQLLTVRKLEASVDLYEKLALLRLVDKIRVIYPPRLSNLVVSVRGL
jgi:hypothetical protein